MKLDFDLFHDAELNSISHDRTNAVVQLKFRRVDEAEVIIQLEGVSELRVADYKLQNVVYELLLSSVFNFSKEGMVNAVAWLNSESHGACSLSNGEIEDIVRDINEGKYILFALNPSCGAEIVIMARNVDIIY